MSSESAGGWHAGIARAIHFFIGAQGCDNPDEADGILRADTAGKSLIHAACSSGNLAVVKWLHEHDADLAARDNLGMQPIHCACSWGHLEVVQWLHAAGAAVDAADGAGVQPMHIACSSGRLDIVQRLHTLGADIACKDYSGMQPVHAASAGGHTAVGVWLKSMGASLNVPDENGVQPLGYACVSGHTEMAAWLRSEMSGTVDLREALEWAMECKAANASSIVAMVYLWAQEAADVAAEGLWAEEDSARLKQRKKPAAKRRRARLSRADAGSNGSSLLHAATDSVARTDAAAAHQAGVTVSLELCQLQRPCKQEILLANPPDAPPGATSNTPAGALDAALLEAVASGDLAQIKAAIKSADGLGCEAATALLSNARALRDRLRKSEKKQAKRLAAATEALRVLEACQDGESLCLAVAVAQPFAQYSSSLLMALAAVPGRRARLADLERASAKAHYIEKLDEDLLSLQLARMAQAEHGVPGIPNVHNTEMPPSELTNQAASGASGDDACCVCLDARRTHCFIPCGHLCVCLACATSLFGGPCPVCRVPCEQAVKVFFS